jgi:predicted transcriptional regulator
LDYSFDNKIDVKLIALFIIDNFKMPVPNSFLVDTIALEPFVNYFDLQQQIAELSEKGLVTYYTEDCDRFFSITKKGTEALSFFGDRIPKTVRERLLNAIRIKVKELKNALSIKAEYEKINDIEYNVALSISEGHYDMFSVSVSVGDELMAKKICASFKNNPQSFYSEFLAVMTKDV